eukprot:snap_masked-scaffold_10-processed-gene-13.6-mRNA-1 protein AED:1.00 eAED:1.00 QI:0/-1/0/0/-1/1/1/0/60
MEGKRKFSDIQEISLCSYIFYFKDRRTSVKKEKPVLKFGEYSEFIGEERKFLPLEKKGKH